MTDTTSDTGRTVVLTKAETAKRLKRSESTLNHWQQIGYGPRSARLGKRVYYIESELEEFVRSEFDAQSR